MRIVILMVWLSACEIDDDPARDYPGEDAIEAIDEEADHAAAPPAGPLSTV